MHAKNSKTMVRKYFTKCESVNDYIDMLTTYEIYHSFQDELFSQWFLDEIDVYKLIDELDIYAEDINY